MPIAAACFYPDKPDQVAVFYEPVSISTFLSILLFHLSFLKIYTTSYGAIYNVRNPEKPLRLLSCEASILCCASSMVYLFAGCVSLDLVLLEETIIPMSVFVARWFCGCV